MTRAEAIAEMTVKRDLLCETDDADVAAAALDDADFARWASLNGRIKKLEQIED